MRVFPIGGHRIHIVCGLVVLLGCLAGCGGSVGVDEGGWRNGGGVPPGLSKNPTPSPGPGPVIQPSTTRFGYVANASDNTLSIFALNAATGQLSPRGHVTTGTSPQAIALDPAGKFVFVVNNLSDDLSTYTINPSTGGLTALSGSPFATGSGPVSVAVDRSGAFAYVANADSNNVSAYAIHPTTGVLTEISGSPFAAGTNPQSVAVSGTIQ